MPGCEWTEHRGRRILIVTYTGCLTDDAMLKVLAEQVVLVRAEPTPVLVLHDYTGAHLGEKFLEETKRLGRERLDPTVTRRTIAKGAMVGLGGFQKALITAYRLATGDTSSRAFSTKAEALDWLAEP